MKFGPLPVEDAIGSIAAHGLKFGDFSVRKGSPISPEHARRLLDAGTPTVVAATLEPGDVGEDEAALSLARAVAGTGVRVERPFTGRSNLHAAHAGILTLDISAINRINAVDEAVTLATLPAFRPVVEGEMIGTVKIIPYAVAGAALEAALAHAQEPSIAVSPYRIARVGAISTLLPGLKPSVVRKTISTLNARLSPAGASVVAEANCAHDKAALAELLAGQLGRGVELIVVFGASAIADRRDVIPTAIEAAGGRVEHFGMPVDPGNLLLVGHIGEVPVIGAPGCARSPVENGFDWVLQRLLAGIPVARADIAALGVGGLLMEIVSRGQPREGGAGEQEA